MPITQLETNVFQVDYIKHRKAQGIKEQQQLLVKFENNQYLVRRTQTDSWNPIQDVLGSKEANAITAQIVKHQSLPNRPVASDALLTSTTRALPSLPTGRRSTLAKAETAPQLNAVPKTPSPHPVITQLQSSQSVGQFKLRPAAERQIPKQQDDKNLHEVLKYKKALSNLPLLLGNIENKKTQVKQIIDKLDVSQSPVLQNLVKKVDKNAPGLPGGGMTPAGFNYLVELLSNLLDQEFSEIIQFICVITDDEFFSKLSEFSNSLQDNDDLVKKLEDFFEDDEDSILGTQDDSKKTLLIASLIHIKFKKLQFEILNHSDQSSQEALEKTFEQIKDKVEEFFESLENTDTNNVLEDIPNMLMQNITGCDPKDLENTLKDPAFPAEKAAMIPQSSDIVVIMFLKACLMRAYEELSKMA